MVVLQIWWYCRSGGIILLSPGNLSRKSGLKVPYIYFIHGATRPGMTIIESRSQQFDFFNEGLNRKRQQSIKKTLKSVSFLIYFTLYCRFFFLFFKYYSLYI